MGEIRTLNSRKEQENKTETVFCFTKKTQVNGKIVWIIDKPKLRKFLNKKGFRQLDDNLVRLQDNVIEPCTKKDIYEFCLNHIDDNYSHTPTIEGLFMTKGSLVLLKSNEIVFSLKHLEVPFLTDTKRKSYIPFLNGVLEVTKDSSTLLNYKNLKKCIWSAAIIERKYKKVSGVFDFEKFLKLATNEDKEHLKSVMTGIGYLLHGYKDFSRAILVAFNDAEADGQKANGRTGKGLIAKAIGEIVPTISFNGKNLNFKNNRFAFQKVKDSTQIIFIHDINKNFDLQDFYSVITDGFEKEMKNRDPIDITYEKAPKFSVTANYPIQGLDSPSSRARIFNVYLTNYFNERYSPIDEFGKQFFNEWNKKEWNGFYCFMVKCLQVYLKIGFFKYNEKEFRLAALIESTSVDFWYLMTNKYNKENVVYYQSEIRNDLIKINQEKYGFLTGKDKVIKRWLDLFVAHFEKKITHERDRNGMAFKIKKFENRH